jgi:hypothetical protein
MIKMAKKAKKKTTMDIMKSVRNTWGNVNPVTRVHGTKKGYDRNKEKRKAQKDLDSPRAINLV